MGNPRRNFCLGGMLALLLVMAGCATPVSHPSPPRSTAAAADSVAANAPAPIFRPREKILFLGDETIDAGCWWASDLYPKLWQDYIFELAAEYGTAYPRRSLVFIDRRLSGDKIASLAFRWQKDCLALKPTVISIIIGVNNMKSEFGGQRLVVRDFEKKYDQLLARTVAANPQIRLILCEPFIYPDKRTRRRWNELETSLQPYELAVDELGAKFHVPVVHFQPILDTMEKQPPVSADTKQGVTYLTPEERQLMAAEWVRVYQSFYGVAKNAKHTNTK